MIQELASGYSRAISSSKDNKALFDATKVNVEDLKGAGLLNKDLLDSLTARHIIKNDRLTELATKVSDTGKQAMTAILRNGFLFCHLNLPFYLLSRLLFNNR